MTRPARIALNILLPPLFAAGCFVLFFIAASIYEVYYTPNRNLGDAVWGVIGLSLYTIIVAYVVAAIPSVLHAVLMELVYRRIPANDWAAVGISTLSGACAGTLIAGLFTRGKFNQAPMVLLYVGLGAFVGFLLGIFIKKLSKPKSETNRYSLRGCE